MKVDFIRHAAGMTAVISGAGEEFINALAGADPTSNGLSVIAFADSVDWELVD